MSALDMIPGEYDRNLIHSAIQARLKSVGELAFASPRKLAAFHEIGHAICFAAEQVPVYSVELFQLPFRPGHSRPRWGGYCTASGGPFGWGRNERTDAATMNEEKLFHCIRMLISGAAGEWVLYGKEIPGASSIDEIAVSQFLIGGRTWDRDPGDIWQDLFDQCRATIKRNEKIAREIMRAFACGVDKLEGNQLQVLLGGTA
jgi:hypothetical protein